MLKHGREVSDPPPKARREDGYVTWAYPPGEPIIDDPDDGDGGAGMRERRRRLLAEEGRDAWGALQQGPDLPHWIWHERDPGFLLRLVTYTLAPDTDPDNRAREEQEAIGVLLRHAARRLGFTDAHIARALDMPEWRIIDVWLGQYVDARWPHYIAAILGYQLEVAPRLVPIAKDRPIRDVAAFAERSQLWKLRRRRLRKTRLKTEPFTPRVIVRRGGARAQPSSSGESAGAAGSAGTSMTARAADPDPSPGGGASPG